MTVKELIAHLQKLPSAARVVTPFEGTLEYVDIELPHIKRLGQCGTAEMRYYGLAHPYYRPGPNEVDMVVID